jgi:transposase
MWLEDHPGVEIISRDRASCYAEGAKQGAPKAIQIADRWHLLKNSGDAFQRLLKGHPKAIREATQQMNQQETTLKTDDPAPACTTDSHETSSVAVPQPIPTEAETRRQMNFQQVKLLQQQESGIREISRQVGISRHTVRTYMAVDTLPERAVPANRSPKINPYLAYLAHRWNEGEHKFKNLFEEIQAQGYTGSLVSLYKAKIRFAGTDCLKGKSQKAAPKYRSLSARKATMLLCKDPEKLNPEQERFCEALCQCCPEVETAKTLIYDFNEIVKNQLENSLDSWLDKALATDIKQIRNFATGLKSDYQAVHAALTYSWSNGQVEGQVNRLKNIKRQMYGRANFSLLRKRVLYAPRPP